MRAFIFALLFSQVAIAHPTSFEGAKGIMGFHNTKTSHNQINYSWRYWLATGLHHIETKEDDFKASFLTANFLLKRWNNEKFQANIYLGTGPGIVNDGGESQDGALGFLQFDIENREYYFLNKHQQIFGDNKLELTSNTARIGFAPYVAQSGRLHSWLILEYNSTDFKNKKYEDLVPLLRLFYQNLLFEIGISFKGRPQFNYIVHF